MTSDLLYATLFQPTLRAEAAALTLLAEDPPLEALDNALIVLQTAAHAGLIAFTGLGKSGLLARRAAATFTSIGAPSIYLHPTDALHGDLGLLAPAWALVALSKSGDTQEVVQLAMAADPMPVIAISEGGQLASVAHVHVPLPVLPEAHDHPAPTVSLALQAALCDCLAMALASLLPNALRRFRASHPGGTLGLDA